MSRPTITWNWNRFATSTLLRAAACGAFVLALPMCTGCITAASAGASIAGGAVDAVDVDDLKDDYMGGEIAEFEKEIGPRLDTLTDIYTQRVWYEYPARTDPLKKDKYLVEVSGEKIIAISRVEKTPDAKFDIPRAIAIKDKVEGKPIAECEALVDMGKPLATVRRSGDGLLYQWYDGGVIKIGDPYYCVLSFDKNEKCTDVKFYDAGSSTKKKPIY